MVPSLFDSQGEQAKLKQQQLFVFFGDEKDGAWFASWQTDGRMVE